MTDSPSTSTMVWIHVIAAIPPTLAAVAALIKAVHVKRDTERIVVAVNGRVDALLKKLETP